MLPGLSGLELQRRLAGQAELPMPLMSGVSGAAEAISAFHAGALDFLIEPIDADCLLSAVSRALSVSDGRRREEARRIELAGRYGALTDRELEVAQWS